MKAKNLASPGGATRTKAGSPSCAGHRRREAVASCAVCNSPICGDCLVATPVGLKCASCTGVRPGAASPHPRGRGGALVTGLGVLVAVVVVYALLSRGEPSSPRIGEEERVAGPVERMVQINGAGRVRIAGTLRLPERTRPARVPGVLVVPGFGSTDRDGLVRPGGERDLLYRDVSEELAQAGIATFRYDKRGTGRSVLPTGQRLAFEDMVTDGRAGVDFLAHRAEIDAGALGVVGHDEGALLAMRIAASDRRVRSLVLISSPGRPLVDVIADDFRSTHGEGSAVKAREIVEGVMATGTLPAPESLSPEHRDFFPREHIPYLREVFSIDPAAYAQEVAVPVLIVRGGRATPGSEGDAERLAAALAADAEVLVAPEAGSTLARAPVGGESAGGHGGGGDHHRTGLAGRERDGAALARISSWLSRRLGAPGGA